MELSNFSNRRLILSRISLDQLRIFVLGFKSTSTPAQRSNSQSKLQGSQNSNSILNYTPSIVTTTDSSGTGGGGGSIGNSSSFKSHDSRSELDVHELF